MMKWLGYIFLPVLLIIGAAWWAIQGTLGGTRTEVAPAAFPRSAAAYPLHMWREAAQLPKDALQMTQGSPEEVPASLVWQDGAAEPPLGSPLARKGGIVRLCSVGPYPANMLAFGSPSPQFFHTNAFERVDLPLVQQHPTTRNEIPGVARAWAVHGRVVYFRLYEQACYSNGRPVRAADYVLGALLRAGAGADGSWAALCRVASELRVYDEHTLSVTLRHEGPMAALRAAAVLHPAEPGFYAEFGSDYAERYAWRIPPTTGAYSISHMEQGRLITLQRVQKWWAAELPHRRFTCNVDQIEYHFLTDEAQAWEFLLRGKLDALQTRNIAAWQRYAEHEECIVKCRFAAGAASAPLPPYGIAINAQLLPDSELRRGLVQAMDMQRAIRILFRGEGQQLASFISGYGELSPRHTPPWSYSPEAARACFARAGYTVVGPDGILCKEDGARLSFPLTFVPSEKISGLVAILKESAASCGLEIVPEPLPWQLCAAKVREGRHALTFWAAVPSAPLPDPARFLSSRASGDEAPFCLRDEDMDHALSQCENARTLQELADALAEVDLLVHHLGIWLPGWREDQLYLAHRHRLRIPHQTGWYYDIMDNHFFWCEEGGAP